MHSRWTRVVVSLGLLLLYAVVQVALSYLYVPPPDPARLLPHIEGATACDSALGVDQLLRDWSPPLVNANEDYVLTDADSQGVRRLRELAHCSHTHPQSVEHTLPVFSGLRVLQAHALAEHRAGRSEEAAQVLIDGWALAQNLGHDTVLNALVGLASQTALLTRLNEVATEARAVECLGPFLRAEQVRSRFVSPDLRIERTGLGEMWHANLRRDWRYWAVWTWSAAEAKRAVAGLEVVLAQPGSERAAALQGFVDEGPSWWTKVIWKDWAARGIQSIAPDAVAEQNDMETARDEALDALRACATQVSLR